MPLIVDTGILYALADRRDAWHARAMQLFATDDDERLAPVTVLPEVTYLLHTRLGPPAALAFVKSLEKRELEIEALRDADVTRAAQVMERYPDLGFVDATIVAMAERLKVSRLASTDRRHFAVVRPKHVERFELVPS